MKVEEHVLRTFEELFGAREQAVRLFFAPGRVNLIGEHTDYTGGYVFPAALTMGTWALVRPREDGRFRLASTSFTEQVEVAVDAIVYREEDDWANYPKGVIAALHEQGVVLGGADVLYHGNLPNGAGLSSSASIELVTAVALQTLFGGERTRVELVQLAQRVENQFIGVQCGIMDQFAVGMGREDHAMLLHCDTLEYAHVPLALGEHLLVVTHTNKRRGLLDSKYNERRAECDEALQLLQARMPELACLGALTEEQFAAHLDCLPTDVLRRRVEHVVRENARVLRSRVALEQGDLLAFGRAMRESHVSLRDLYEVTGPELDALYEAAVDVEGCVGTRMTGAGFGGCTVSIVHRDHVAAFQEQVTAAYQARTGLVPTFYTCSIGDGAREVTEEVEAWRFS